MEMKSEDAGCAKHKIERITYNFICACVEEGNDDGRAFFMHE